MRENTKALLAYIAVCIFWGSTYLFIRIGVEDFPPFLFASFRFLIAGTIMMIYVRNKKLTFILDKSQLIRQAIIGLFMLLGGTGLVCVAETTLQSSIASLIISTVPLFIATIELVILRSKKMSFIGIIGLFVGFGGVAYLALADMGTFVFDGRGMLFALMASLSWSVGSIFSKHSKSDSHVLANVSIQMLSGGLGLLILGLVFGEASDLSPSISSIMALGYLVIFGSLVGYSCYIYVLEKWPASKVGTYAYVNPVVALILGVLVLNEPINVLIVMTLVVILSGVILVQKSKVKDLK